MPGARRDSGFEFVSAGASAEGWKWRKWRTDHSVKCRVRGKVGRGCEYTVNLNWAHAQGWFEYEQGNDSEILFLEGLRMDCGGLQDETLFPRKSVEEQYDASNR